MKFGGCGMAVKVAMVDRIIAADAIVVMCSFHVRRGTEKTFRVRR